MFRRIGVVVFSDPDGFKSVFFIKASCGEVGFSHLQKDGFTPCFGTVSQKGFHQSGGKPSFSKLTSDSDAKNLAFADKAGSDHISRRFGSVRKDPSHRIRGGKVLFQSFFAPRIGKNLFFHLGKKENFVRIYRVNFNHKRLPLPTGRKAPLGSFRRISCNPLGIRRRDRRWLGAGRGSYPPLQISAG